MPRHAALLASVLAIAAATGLTAGAAPNDGRAEVIGLPRAVAIAEATVKGRVLEAEMDYEKGRLVYEVRTTAGSQVQEVLIDAMSGEVVAERPLRLDSLWRKLRHTDQLNAVRAGSTTLSQQLAKLETERRARVTEVSLERERGQTYYEVDLSDSGRKVLIDPRTGAVREGRYDD